MRGGPGRTIDNPVKDDFERAALGGDWTVYLGNAAIVGSSNLGASAASGIHIAGWTATTLGADQVIEARLTADPSVSLMETQVFGRRRTSDVARYGLHYHVFAGLWELKYDGVPTEDTRLLATDGVAAPPSAGSVLRLEIKGTGATVNIKGYHNGFLILEANDTDVDRITTAGPVGLVSRAQTGETPTYPVGLFSQFAAGTLREAA